MVQSETLQNLHGFTAVRTSPNYSGFFANSSLRVTCIAQKTELEGKDLQRKSQICRSPLLSRYALKDPRSSVYTGPKNGDKYHVKVHSTYMIQYPKKEPIHSRRIALHHDASRETVNHELEDLAFLKRPQHQPPFGPPNTGHALCTDRYCKHVGFIFAKSLWNQQLSCA